MYQETTKACVELLGLYGSALEYTLRVNRLLAAGAERAVKAQVDLVDAAAEHLVAFGRARDPEALARAQSTLMKELGDEVVTTTRNLLAIQKETHADLRALAQEGMHTFSPALVKPLTPKMPKAA
ncbi:MAG: phasin family protein [Gammaproteobacteria bacterium]|nr:phasin family protein [Gammaproteobacteria bacterium]NIR83893.1 phasin family protein [Gammaproteobacteria bacterium]NIR90672.1 phasin family protein [Gammaproteobacteria bacterium]NIV76061.1 hypothetical protein [Gammaproteobacteria bacterium]